MKRVEVRVLIGVEVGDGGVCCGDSDDWDNYWGQSGGKTWGVKKKNERTQMMWWIKQMDYWWEAEGGWVYRRGGERLQGCIHTERRNLRNTRGTDGGVLLGQRCFSQERGGEGAFWIITVGMVTDLHRNGRFLGGEVGCNLIYGTARPVPENWLKTFVQCEMEMWVAHLGGCSCALACWCMELWGWRACVQGWRRGLGGSAPRPKAVLAARAEWGQYKKPDEFSRRALHSPEGSAFSSYSLRIWSRKTSCWGQPALHWLWLLSCWDLFPETLACPPPPAATRSRALEQLRYSTPFPDLHSRWWLVSDVSGLNVLPSSSVHQLDSFTSGRAIIIITGW